MTNPETTTLTAELPSALVARVDELADRLERSRDWVVKQALHAWLDLENERNWLTREALADVDAGRVIEHQAVQAWAASLDSDEPLPFPESR